MAVHSVAQFSVTATPVGDAATDKFRVFLGASGDVVETVVSRVCR